MHFPIPSSSRADLRSVVYPGVCLPSEVYNLLFVQACLGFTLFSTRQSRACDARPHVFPPHHFTRPCSAAEAGGIDRVHCGALSPDSRPSPAYPCGFAALMYPEELTAVTADQLILAQLAASVAAVAVRPRVNGVVNVPPVMISEDRARLLRRLEEYCLRERAVVGDGACQVRCEGARLGVWGWLCVGERPDMCRQRRMGRRPGLWRRLCVGAGSGRLWQVQGQCRVWVQSGVRWVATWVWQEHAGVHASPVKRYVETNKCDVRACEYRAHASTGRLTASGGCRASCFGSCAPVLRTLFPESYGGGVEQACFSVLRVKDFADCAPNPLPVHMETRVGLGTGKVCMQLAAAMPMGTCIAPCASRQALATRLHPVVPIACRSAVRMRRRPRHRAGARREATRSGARFGSPLTAPIYVCSRHLQRTIGVGTSPAAHICVGTCPRSLAALAAQPAVLSSVLQAREKFDMYVPQKYDRYLSDMAKPGTWGDHVTLQAFAGVEWMHITVLACEVTNWNVKLRRTPGQRCGMFPNTKRHLLAYKFGTARSFGFHPLFVLHPLGIPSI
eukprot:355383-Chlamydomonas_euryale.AAC.7